MVNTLESNREGARRNSAERVKDFSWASIITSMVVISLYTYSDAVIAYFSSANHYCSYLSFGALALQPQNIFGILTVAIILWLIRCLYIKVSRDTAVDDKYDRVLVVVIISIVLLSVTAAC